MCWLLAFFLRDIIAHDAPPTICTVSSTSGCKICLHNNNYIMFNGLSVKSSDGGRPNSNGSSSASAATGIVNNEGSGFSFLNSNPPVKEDRSIPSPPSNQQGVDDVVASDILLLSPAGVTSSGFSFLSTPMTSQQTKQEVVLDSSITNPNTSSDTDNSTSNSGFSFLSNKTTTYTATEEEKIGYETSTSVFSFLNSSVGVSATQLQHQIPKEYSIEKEESTTNQPSELSLLGQGALQPNNSLNSDVATSSLPQLAATSNLPSYTVIPNNPLFSSNTITAAAAAENKHIPTPSTIGVVFEGASKPGAIQKKRRGKKIGVGAQDQQEAISTAPESYNATISTTSHQHQQQPSVSSQEGEAEKIRTAAAVAAERAEQFILQKQKEICREVHTNTFSSDSSSILHTGRYGASKESKNEVVPSDATVEAAERAAKEAQHRMVNGSGNNPTKNGIMSGFFGRTSKKFGFHLGNTSIHGKGTVGNTQNDGDHSGSNTPPRQYPSDSGIISNDSYKPNPSESIQAPPDPPASSHLTTPTRNGSSLSFIIPATTLSITTGVTNAVHDGAKRDETIDQATMQQRLEEERRAQFKEQERLWQAAQKEREEYERLAREREEERLRKLAEEERRKNRSPQEKMDELLATFSAETQQAMQVVVEVRFLHKNSKGALLSLKSLHYFVLFVAIS